MSQINVIIIEDDPSLSQILKKLFSSENVFTFHNSEAFFSSPLFAKGKVDFILQDLCSAEDPEGIRSLELLSDFRAQFPAAEIWVQSAVEEVAKMKAAIRAGANRFVSKESLLTDIPLILDWVRQRLQFQEEASRVLRGNSPLMLQFREQLSLTKFSSHSDILIEAETGSGKELCARLLAGEAPWVAVNCSAIPADLFEAEFFGAEKGSFTGASQARVGYFEASHQGVLFLDEIQALPLTMQAKLLRVIEERVFRRVGSTQERRFTGRIISASNLNLMDQVRRGQFREDLYYRLSTLKLQIPPLRARKDDVGDLFQSFLDEAGARHLKIQAEALSWMRTEYDWPGNVRELKALAKRLAIKAQIPVIDIETLSSLLEVDELQQSEKMPSQESTFDIDWNLGLDANVEKLEKHMLLKAKSMPKSSEARKFLKIARSRYYEKLRYYGLVTRASED